MSNYNNCCTCCTKSSSACRAVSGPLYAVLRVLENIPIIGHLIAAVYACSQCTDRAERAGVKASMGLVLAVCSCPAEAVDEVIRYRSPRLLSYCMRARPDWMKTYHRRTLRHLCMPASHQSATYYMAGKLDEIPLVEGWSRCQDLSIDAQLWGGVRLLDLRVMSHDHDVWTHHQKVICVKLRDVLDVVRDFLSENPSEIVFLYVTNDGKHVDWMNVHSLLNEYLGTKLIPEHMRDMNIGDIVQYGKNVVVAGIPNVAYSWQGIDHRWPNKHRPRDLLLDFTQTAEQLRNYNPYFLFWYKHELTATSHTIVRSLGGLPSVCVSSCVEEKFDFQEDAAACVNHNLLNVLLADDPLPYNFISTDYINDDIIERIIARNSQALGGAGPMVYREVLEGSRDNLLTEVRVDQSFAILDTSTMMKGANFSRAGTLERKGNTGTQGRAAGTPDRASGTPDRASGTPDRHLGTPDRFPGTLERIGSLDRSYTAETGGRTEPMVDLYQWQKKRKKLAGMSCIQTPSDPMFTIT